LSMVASVRPKPKRASFFTLFVANYDNHRVPVTGMDFHFDRVGLNSIDGSRTDFGEHRRIYAGTGPRVQFGFLTNFFVLVSNPPRPRAPGRAGCWTLYVLPAIMCQTEY